MIFLRDKLGKWILLIIYLEKVDRGLILLHSKYLVRVSRFVSDYFVLSGIHLIPIDLGHHLYFDFAINYTNKLIIVLKLRYFNEVLSLFEF